MQLHDVVLLSIIAILVGISSNLYLTKRQKAAARKRVDDVLAKLRG